MKIIPGIGTIATVSFVVYVFLSDSPTDRMDRTCKPIMWTGDLIHSVSSSFNASYSTLNTITKYTIDYDNKCKETVWSFFYKDDYLQTLNQYQQEQINRQKEQERKMDEELQEQYEKEHRVHKTRSLEIR